MLSELERLLYEPEFKKWERMCFLSDVRPYYYKNSQQKIRYPPAPPGLLRERAIAALQGLPLPTAPTYNPIDLWFTQIYLPSLTK